MRSFKDGRYYTVPKKEATEFTRDLASKQDGPAMQAAMEYLDGDVLPPHWDRDSLFGLNNSSSENNDEIDTDSSDDEPREEKDRFVAQLYKYMDDRGTPLNKVPSIQNRDVDLYRLFRAVQKRGGYNRVTTQNQWKSVANRLGFHPATASIINLVKQAYKKFLQSYGDFHRKLGCSMLMSPRNSSRSKGRSLVRANSVASPKLGDSSKDHLHHTSITLSKLAAGNSSTPISNNTSNNIAIINANTTMNNNNNNIANTTIITTTTTTTTTTSTSVPTSTLITSITSTHIARASTTPNTTVSGLASSGAVSTASTTHSTGALPSEESENTNESFQESGRNKRKYMAGSKTKNYADKYDDKTLKDDCDVPLAKIRATAVREKEESLLREREREREREGEREREREREKEREREREKSKDVMAAGGGSTSKEMHISPTSSTNDPIFSVGKLNSTHMFYYTFNTLQMKVGKRKRRLLIE